MRQPQQRDAYRVMLVAGASLVRPAVHTSGVPRRLATYAIRPPTRRAQPFSRFETHDEAMHTLSIPKLAFGHYPTPYSSPVGAMHAQGPRLSHDSKTKRSCV